MSHISVRLIVPKEFNSVAKMHEQMLSDEFIVRFGNRFLRCYYRAFAESHHSVALVAVDNTTNSILGALLGTLNPSLHYKYLTRHHGIYFAGMILLRSMLHFKLARDLIRTRAKRYTLGVLRNLRSKREPRTISSSSNLLKVGEITHLFVNRTSQSKGVGSSLVLAYNEMAKDAGVHCVDLVTANVEKGGAGPFYEKLGWELMRKHVNQSGEEFLLYRLYLTDETEQ